MNGESKDLSGTKLEEVEVALAAAARVNRHLNEEVESLLHQLQSLEAERDAWRARARQLASLLAAQRRSGAAGQGADGGGADEDDVGAVDAAIAAAAGPPLPPFAWPGDECVVAQLMERAKAGGWLVPLSELVLGQTLGAGAFGTTRKAAWRGAEVAAKLVRISTVQELCSFVREADALSRLRHPNVVPFLGVVVEGPEACWLLFEFMPGGTLAAWLAAARTGAGGSRRPFLERVARGLEVAQALAELEACRPQVLHRDVKPSNIFLDAAGAARLGDFGLARPLPPNRGELTGETGTYQYMAPEMIRHEVYDTKADIWSLGVVLAELITGATPYEHLYMTPVQVAMGVADEKLKPWLPSRLHPGLLAAASACCDYDPQLRPNAATVASELHTALHELRQQAQVQVQPAGLLGRLWGTPAVPPNWTGVLSEVATAQVQARLPQQQSQGQRPLREPQQQQQQQQPLEPQQQQQQRQEPP